MQRRWWKLNTCYFGGFQKTYSKAKRIVRQNDYKVNNYWKKVLIKKESYQHVKETDTSKWREHCHVFTWPYAIHFIPMNMVRTRVRGNLRMRKQNTNTTVPLDVVPERRTERCSPRFRPGGRFCELRFRYLSSPTGREGEISRPLDHMRQIPFIHSARLLNSTNFYIYRTVF